MWEERISRTTHPAIQLEHALRYRLAMPIVMQSPLWVDLGAGGGIAAARALESRLSGELLLVDQDETALASARDELLAMADEVETIAADLTDPDALARVVDKMRDRDSGNGGCITCFEVIEHLDNFVPLLGLLREAAGELGYTAVISVPNDSFWGIDNPHHHAMWSGDAFDEFLRLLPEPRVIARQMPLVGAAIVVGDSDDDSDFDLPVSISQNGIPSHYLVAFGEQIGLLEQRGEVAQSDLERQRSWERQREADVAFLRQAEEDLAWMHKQSEKALAEAEQKAAGTSAQ